MALTKRGHLEFSLTSPDPVCKAALGSDVYLSSVLMAVSDPLPATNHGFVSIFILVL